MAPPAKAADNSVTRPAPVGVSATVSAPTARTLRPSPRTRQRRAEAAVPGRTRDHRYSMSQYDDLDDLDRELLNAVQWDFPLDPRPFAVLGERLGISEPD